MLQGLAVVRTQEVEEEKVVAEFEVRLQELWNTIACTTGRTPRTV